MSFCAGIKETGRPTLEVLFSDQGDAQHICLSCFLTHLRHRAAHERAALHIFIFSILLFSVCGTSFRWFRPADEIRCMDGSWFLRILLLVELKEHSILLSDCEWQKSADLLLCSVDIDFKSSTEKAISDLAAVSLRNAQAAKVRTTLSSLKIFAAK